MRCGSDEKVYTTSFPSTGGKIARIAGTALVVVGLALIVLCVPLWAWLALVGIALVIAGALLLRK